MPQGGSEDARDTGARAPSGPAACHTRLLKSRRRLATSGPGARSPPLSTRAAAPLFSGTVHFLTIQFQTPSGVMGLSVDDIGTAAGYCATIAPIAARYASQYGPTSVRVDPKVSSMLVTPSGGTTYSDAELGGWVDRFAASANLSAGDAVAVINPPSGVENTDAQVSQGVLGYHSISPKGHPYIFVNAQGMGFVLRDPSGYFALALSHELQEMLVDPRADDSNPEVCDPCAGNCSPNTTLGLFDPTSNYLGSVTTPTTAPPAGAQFTFYVSSMVRPANARDCPAPPPACAYPPP